MKSSLIAFIVGLLFAIGLGISGMTNPQKVIGFLDVFGRWDPSLAFVMLGAVIPHFVTFKLIRLRKEPLLSPAWHIPKKRELTLSLIAGSLLFGIGWGLAGYCPGPAITNISTLRQEPLIFVLSMIAGMWLFKISDQRWRFNR